jgi:NADH-quinone oxidoreductase subunit K
MFQRQLVTNFFLYFLGIAGIAFNSRNILIILVCLEVVLLSVNLNFILFSAYLDDFYGQVYSLFVLTVVAAESAIGLGILIIFFRLNGDVSVYQKNHLKG